MPSDTGEQHDQYVTAFSAKSSEIDVFDADSIWPAEFAQANYALELDRFIEADNIDMDAYFPGPLEAGNFKGKQRSEEHTSELQSRGHLVCRLLLEKKKKNN